MSTHTAGPWLYRGKSCAVYTAPPAGAKYSFGDHIFTFHEDEEPNDDDLALILAAPDLLEALKEFVDEHSSHSLTETERLQKARTAIAKATGGQQ